MKYIYLLTVVAITTISGIASAQQLKTVTSNDRELFYTDYSNEMSISDGYLSGRQMFNSLSGEDRHYTLTGRTGNVFVTYRHYFNEKYSLGATLGTETLHYLYNNSYNFGTYSFTQTVTTLAVEFRGIYRYTGIDWFEDYFIVGLGISHFDESGAPEDVHQGPTSPLDGAVSGFGFNSQITLLGLRFGKRLGGYIEFGLGYKGLVNGGISYRFSKAE